MHTKILIIFTVLATLIACSSSGSEGSEAKSAQISSAARDTIIAVAKTDALKAASATDEREYEALILEIKSRESDFRSAGLKASADLYISTAKSMLDSLSAKQK